MQPFDNARVTLQMIVYKTPDNFLVFTYQHLSMKSALLLAMYHRGISYTLPTSKLANNRPLT